MGKLEDLEQKYKASGAALRKRAAEALGSAPSQIVSAAVGGVAAGWADRADIGGLEAGPIKVQAGLYVGPIVAYLGRNNAMMRSLGLGATGYGAGQAYNAWMDSEAAKIGAAAAAGAGAVK